MSKLNLLMLNYEFPPIGGGAGKAHLCQLKEYAQTNELKIDVLTAAPKPGFTHEQFSDNITIYKVGLHKKNLHFWRKIEVLEWLFKAQHHYRKMLRENNYDLVHAFFGFPTGWLCYRSANKLPYIISLRGSDVPGKHARLKLDYKILAPVFKAIWKKASTLIACSQGLKDRALQFMPSATIDVITNGIDLDMFHPAPKRDSSRLGKSRPAQNDKSQQKLKLLTVGRLSVTKRFEILIDTVEILHKAGRNLHLTIAGGGAMLDGLKQIVSQKNLGNIIDVKGRIESDLMPDLYRQNDIFVSASMQEGMSNAMLEAMASGLPIITTRCEGVDELIADNGIVVEQPRPDAIADEIQKLADDKNGYELMCKAARKKVEQFGWDNITEQYLRYYKNIANQYG